MADKKEMYRQMNLQLKSLLDGETDMVANMANISAVIYDTLEDLNWAGFYIMKNGELILGPFQGKVACMHIAVGRGVCGTAVARRETVLVKNVHEFPGHIACDSASNSEIVVPIFVGNEVIGVLDIDSPSLSRFDEEDQAGLLATVKILENTLK